MNRTRSYCTLIVCLLGALLLTSLPAYAGLQIPYTTNANTLHLWHLNDAQLNGAATNILVVDSVATSGITLTNLGQPIPGTPPYTNATLGNASYNGMGTCWGSKDKYGLLYGGLFSDVSPFCDTNTGAFTFEALVKFTGNPLTLANNTEIICGDQPTGTLSQRGWQFRITTSGQVEFNLLGGSGSDNDWKVSLPSSGSDAAIAGQWYHVAVTCTGNAPTNGDTANQLNVYWTLVDSNRTSASLLTTFTMTRSLNGSTSSGAGTVQPAFGIGGSGRKITSGGNGVANGEGLIGLVDEVRISNIALASNQMAFVSGGTPTPPSITVQPSTNIFIGYGRTLTVPAIAVGSLPLSYQWQLTNSTSGGYTNVPNQTNSSLVISGIDFGSSGGFRMVITNSYGSITSVVSRVTVGAAFSELYNTGISTNGVVDTTLAASADPHYTLIQSADINHLGPNALVWDMNSYPTANHSGNFSVADSKSQWVGPQANSYISPTNQYVYRMKFLLDSVDVTKSVSLSGIWSANEYGNDILINGQSTGNSLSSAASGSGKFSTTFTITNGFVAGVNTLDFVTTKSSGSSTVYQEAALRVDMSDPVITMSGVGTALAAGKPTILTQPANVSVRDNQVASGSTATFSVVALGRPPLSYQWWADGNAIQDATNRVLSYASPDSTAGLGSAYKVVISNSSGSVTSSVVTLTLTTNHPPAVNNYTFNIYSNTAVTFDLSAAFSAATDVDGDVLSLSTYDTTTTNGVALTQLGTLLTFTAPSSFVGADQFSYTVTDNYDSAQGFVNINVLPLAAPATFKSSKSGTNIVIKATGGSVGGSYHVLSSTNLATALSSWTTNSSGVFDGTGACSITNAIKASVPQSFYIIVVP